MSTSTEYTNEALLEAVRKQIETDEGFKNNLEKAVKTKDTHWLVSLVTQVAEALFGEVLPNLIQGVLDILAGW
jgi:hypothetical protein